MLIISGLAMLALAVMLASPDSAPGRALRRGLVETPARALNRLGRGKVVFFALLAAAGLMLALLFKADGLHLFGLMLPDLMVWFAVFDVGVFIDALLIAGAILAANGLGEARARVAAAPRMIARMIARRQPRARLPRRARPRPTDAAADDDGPGWVHQLPGYRAFSMA
ncbi:hypothetical protein [Brevundimonas sp.]|uniref:hypothetical protein n=1 Tax=Brevundimonas sp. TaxID=1871086 RepID=UPI00122A717E|nr:hypothetical protein [Brevundimonas sp.]TAJ66849.1 MAG: hypothetical protein EPO49_01625 [Brevundimonas sp.]